ncbi:hypothetical protein DL346_08410 [Paenibacillus montanisoli]|uniref:ABC transporter substrate-binding protein n=2 Tax=Paenibacillus montanisoli TaxID=2081970 RepID=A0A328U8N3_9BACL|nr:hypothetical protein DL346_08410 [Paenibacillus montanisoli]
MSKKHKWLSLSLSIVLILSLIAACSNNNATSNNTNGNKNAATNDSNNDTATNTSSSNDTSTNTGDAVSSDDPPELANWKELTLTGVCNMQTTSYVPGQDVLTPIWRAKTKVKLDCSEHSTAGGPTIQQRLAADNLPDSILTSGAGFGTDNYKLLKGANKLHVITKEDIEKWMPRYVKRLEKYGVTLDQVMEANKDPEDGKMYGLPMGGAIGAYPGLQDTRLMDLGWVNQYNAFFRDDILKKIFPNARTEKELRQLYVEKKGQLTYEDMTSDIPINSMDDMLNYLRKVKELNIKEGNKPVSAVLQSTTTNINSVLWSMFTFPGWFWSETGERVQKDGVLTYSPMTQEYKDYFKFWNTAYNEGLVDPESFIMKDDQLNAKIINGELAVFSGWGPIAQARDVVKKENRPYGYRMIPYFPNSELVTKYQDLRYRPASLNAGVAMYLITTNISDEDLPQVLNWFDWNSSEEAADLRTWGLPEFSTGTGADRRFKPEYKALEDWAVRGIKSDKDGWYYGLRAAIDGDPNNGVPYVNHETQMVSMLYPYELAPALVYPPDLTEDFNMEALLSALEHKHFRDMGMKYYPQQGWSFADLDPKGDFDKQDANKAYYSQTGKTKIAKLITGKPGDFEANYADYMKMYDDPLWKKEWAAMQDRYKKLYDEHIKPAIDSVQ